MNLEIRVASATDLDALVHLAAAFREHLGQATPSDADLRASIARLMQDANAEFFLACGPRGTALGYVQCRYRYSAWTSALEAELEDVFVLRQARRRGVGRRLVEFAMARAAAKGCRSIGLNTNERNEDALALYRKCGFAAARLLERRSPALAAAPARERVNGALRGHADGAPDGRLQHRLQRGAVRRAAERWAYGKATFWLASLGLRKDLWGEQLFDRPGAHL